MLGRRLTSTRAARAAFVVPVALCALLIGAGVHRLSGRDGADAPVPHRDRFAVASESGLATRVGIEALRGGANAVDAAISIALVLGVVQPESSGIGGGGFALVWNAAERSATILDFRETAPAAVEPAALDVRPRRPSPAGRGKMIGVPGEVAGLLELHRRFGRRSFAEDARPAVDLARSGFVASRRLAQFALAYHEELAFSPGLRALYKPGDWAVRAGHRLSNASLGATLERIAREGRSAFYEGKVAAEIASAAQATGGTLTEQDLRAYQVVERTPLSIRWEDYVVYTMPPPSAGGLLLAETLGTFGKDELARLGLATGAYHHLLAEAFRGAIADRMRWIGDPARTGVDLSSLFDRERLRKRRSRMALDRSQAVSHFPLEEHGTTHFVVADSAGNVVSFTTTINGGFGAFVQTDSTGVLLNDELSDFTVGRVDALFNANRTGPNPPRPGARPASSMTPTLVLRGGEPELALGGSGGLWITAGVTEALLAYTVFGLPVDQCVAIPRFYTPTEAGPIEGPVIAIDESAPDELVRDLRSRGEIVSLVPNYSAVQMVAFTRGPGGTLRLSAAADPRKGGTALTE
jgi:gamma-glutamyltranspeptidase/glutathione hydrolase